ncbi:MAG: polyprenyl synthetase family protein [Candidatus Heimdallarchaeota archaeon]|nr:polyprenyl synthetase family protein [Candidatus Heimdallarchaeota archaeon]
MAEQFLDEVILENLNKELDQAIEAMESPTKERIRNFILSTKGKQLRPSLIALTTKLLAEGSNGEEEAMQKSYNSAIAIELLHNMTLIHDDLIDNAPIRRGKDSFHIVHGRDRALHDGDVLHAYALTLLKDNPSLFYVIDYAYQVGLGNAIELEDRLDQNFNFDLAHVIKIMELKTAIVFAGCVRLGCLAANRMDLFTKKLDKAIIDAGIAFQIQDDYLDIQGDPEQFGKVQYWDIQESKRNLFLYFALQTEHAEKIKAIYNKSVGEKSKEDIKYVLQVFHSCTEQVKEVRNKYYNAAINGLDEVQNEISPDDTEADDLIEFLKILVRFLIEREK